MQEPCSDCESRSLQLDIADDKIWTLAECLKDAEAELKDAEAELAYRKDVASKYEECRELLRRVHNDTLLCDTNPKLAEDIRLFFKLTDWRASD